MLFRFCVCVANSEPLPSSVTADTVKSYLGEHPEFLDTYIQQNVNSDTIEQWISKKPQTPIPEEEQQEAAAPQPPSRTSSAAAHLPTTAPPVPPPRPSSSTSMPVVSSQKPNISTSTTTVPLSTNTGNAKLEFIIID